MISSAPEGGDSGVNVSIKQLETIDENMTCGEMQQNNKQTNKARPDQRLQLAGGFSNLFVEVLDLMCGSSKDSEN